MASDEESGLKEPLFKDLDAEDLAETGPTELESMCMACGENVSSFNLMMKTNCCFLFCTQDLQ